MPSANKKTYYAHEGRKKRRDESHTKLLIAAQKALDSYLEKVDFFSEQPSTLNYDDIYEFINKTATGVDWKKYALSHFRKIIINLNNKGNIQRPLPISIFDIKRDPPIRNMQWIEYGKWINELTAALDLYWAKQAQYDFSNEEVIGNLLLCAILFSGLNTKASLEALLNHINRREKIQHLHNMPVFIMTEISENYGNITIDTKLGRSRNFVPDYLTQCWLIHLYQIEDIHVYFEPEYYLELVFNKMMCDFNKTIYQNLLKYAHYNWAQLENVDISPALTHCLTGKIPTCNLSLDELKKFIAPLFTQTDQSQYTLHSSDTPTMTHVKPTSQKVSLEKQKKAIIKLHKAFLKMVRISQTERPIIELLIEYCREHQSQFNEYSQRMALWLISLYKPNHEQADRLAKIFHCRADKLYKYNTKHGLLKNSSIYTYYTSIAEPWFIHSLEFIDQNNDINDNLENIYTEIIGNLKLVEDFETFQDQDKEQFNKHEDESIKHSDQATNATINTTIKNSTKMKMLTRFHEFQQDVFDADSMDFGPMVTYRKPRANIISPHTYTLLLKKLITFGQRDGWSEQFILSLQLIYTLAYRTGMRISEITGLRVADVKGKKDFSIAIRPYGSQNQGNQHDLKTRSSLRDIPIYSLLTEEEKRIFYQYIKHKRLTNKPKSYLFTDWQSGHKLKPYQITKPLKIILNEMFNVHDYTFHSLRHSAANYLALVLNCADVHFVEKMTGLSIEHINTIRKDLLPNWDAPNKWFLVACLLGHINPHETFRSYIHLTDLMVGNSLRKHFPHLTVDMVQRITGLRKSWNQYFQLSEGERRFNFEKHAHTLNEILMNHQDHWAKTNINATLRNLPKTPVKNHNYFDYFAGTQASKISFELFYSALQQLQKFNNNKAAQIVARELDLSVDIMDYWLENAKKLANLCSKKGQPRLVQLDQIIPILRDHQEDQEACRYFFKNLHQVYTASPEDIKFVLDMFLACVTYKRGGISCAESKVDDLEKFYKIIKPLFPEALWQIRGNMLSNILSDKKHPLLFNLAQKHNQLHVKNSKSVLQLQLFSEKTQNALSALKFCLHLACIGAPKSL